MLFKPGLTLTIRNPIHKDNTADTKHKNKVKQPTKVYKLDIKVALSPNIVVNTCNPIHTYGAPAFS